MGMKKEARDAGRAAGPRIGVLADERVAAGAQALREQWMMSTLKAQRREAEIAGDRFAPDLKALKALKALSERIAARGEMDNLSQWARRERAGFPETTHPRRSTLLQFDGD